MAKRIVPPGSICFVSIGSTIGKMCSITTPSLTNQQINTLIVDQRSGHPTYIYYALAQRTPHLKAIAGGSATPILNKTAFSAVEIEVLPVEEQHGVGNLLDSLDDMIESRRRAIAMLEELRQLEFQRLLANADTQYLPLAELATVVKGVSYKSAELRPSRTSLVTLKSFDRHGGYKADGLKPYVGPYKPAQVIEPGEIVVAQTDLTQGAEVVGRAVRVPADHSAAVLVASLDLSIVRPKIGLPVEYLLGVLTSEDFRQHCRSRTSGTTVLHLASDAIPTFEAPVVSTELQTSYSETVRPIVARTDALEREVQKLGALRDALLPGMLSGRIRVPEPEGALA